MPLKLLTLGHSYVVAENRRLAHEMAREGRGTWEVTAAAPGTLPGAFGDLELEPIPGEACALKSLGLRFGGRPHVRHYDRRLRALLDGEWDVVHVWEEPYVAACAQAAWLSRGSALFVPATFQNLDKRYPAPVALMERYVMGRAGGWVAFGETAQEVLARRRSYTSKPCRVIPPGVDLQTFRPDPEARRAMRARLGWDDDIPVVGFVGRFVHEKGIGVLLRALEAAPVTWRALLVGGGALAADLRAFESAHAPRVRVLSGVAHAGIPACLAAMDLLCVPSLATPRWREQFGRVLTEAMACGVPVIASCSGEIPRVVGDAGVLVPEGDTSAWAQAIARVSSDRALRRELAARGLSRVHARFSWPIVAREHLRFFQELLARS